MRISALALASMLLARGDALEDLRAWTTSKDGASRVSVRCASSLPEGALVHVSLARIVEGLDSELRQLVPQSTSHAPRTSRRKVEKRAVAAEFEKVEEGAYLVTARFRPDAQPDEIAAALEKGTAESRKSCPLMIGTPADVLKAVSTEESTIRDTMKELLKIGTAPGEDSKSRLQKWFEVESQKAAGSWLPATRDFLRAEVRKLAVWGKGPLRSGDESAKSESNWREFHDMMFTARHLILRERFLWDLRIASTLAMEAKAASESDEMKDRHKAGWAALDAGLPESRVKELISMIGEPAARLVGRIRQGRDLSGASGAGDRADEVIRGLQDDEPSVRLVPKYTPVK